MIMDNQVNKTHTFINNNNFNNANSLTHLLHGTVNQRLKLQILNYQIAVILARYLNLCKAQKVV